MTDYAPFKARRCNKCLKTTRYVVSSFPSLKAKLISLSKILGFQGGDYDECRLLGCDAMWLL
jgi:hypothetical protein